MPSQIISGKVASVEFIEDAPTFVYNIEVADNHNYFANNLLVSNCHRIKSPKSQTNKKLIKHLKKAGRRVLSSGTPLENNIQEIWQLVDFCRAGLLGNNYKFIDHYMEKDFFGSPIGPKPQMMAELQEKIAPIMLRKTKEEAMPDLPALTVTEYWVDMTAEQKSLYKEVKAGILENLATGEFSYLEVLAQITRLQQVVDSPALLSEVVGKALPKASGKITELEHIISDINPLQKFVIFSQFKQMTDIIYQHLTENGIIAKERLGYIHGGMKSQSIATIQKAFQESDMRCVIITTAGNYGIELSAGSYVIAIDCLFNPQKMMQIYSRVHRNGIKNAVTAINILTKGTYEEHKLTILQKKKELFKAMVDSDDEAFAKMFTKQDLINMI